MKKKCLSIIVLATLIFSIQSSASIIDKIIGQKGPCEGDDFAGLGCAVMATSIWPIPTIIIEDRAVDISLTDMQIQLIAEASNPAGEQVLISAIAKKLETSEEKVANAVMAIHTANENQVITLEDIKEKMTSLENN